MKKNGVIFAAVGLILCGALAWFFFFRGDSSPIRGQIQMIDVVSGARTSMAQDKVAFIPARNSAGEKRLFPIIQADDGSWVIAERYQSTLLNRIEEGEIPGETLAVDLQTFRVK